MICKPTKVCFVFASYNKATGATFSDRRVPRRELSCPFYYNLLSDISMDKVQVSKFSVPLKPCKHVRSKHEYHADRHSTAVYEPYNLIGLRLSVNAGQEERGIS